MIFDTFIVVTIRLIKQFILMFLTFEKIPLFVNLNLMGADGNARVHSELINFLYLIELHRQEIPAILLCIFKKLDLLREYFEPRL